jgi:PAS domain S-box-containing protein
MAVGRGKAKRVKKGRAPKALQAERHDGALAAGLAEVILASTPDHIFVFDGDLRYRYASPAGARALGLSHADVVGRTWRELRFPPEIMEPFERKVAGVFASGVSDCGETVFPMPQGLGHFEYVLAPVRDSAGRVESVVCTVRDDTAQWRLRRAIDAIAVPVRAATGEEYLRELVVRLSQVLALRYVVVGEFTDGEVARVRSVATADRGALVNNVDYDLAGTPCENVAGKQTCCYPSDVQRLFPRDAMLTEMGAQAYVGTPLVAPGGKPLGLLAVLHDAPITDIETTKTVLELFAVRAGAELNRRATEGALQRVQRLLLSAEQVGKAGSYEWDLKSNEVQWSPGLYALYGVEPRGAPKVTFEYAMSFVHPDDARKIENNVREVVAGQGRMEILYRIKRPDGTECLLWGHGELVRDAAGVPSHLVGTVHDWSEQAQAAAALRESEERYRSLFENASFGIYRSTVDGRFVAVNPALVAMLGYQSAEELLHANIANDIYVRPEDRRRLVEARFASVGPIEALEVDWQRKDGTPITVRLRGSRAVGLDGLEGFTMTAEEVTVRRQLEDQLRQSQKLEGIGRLAGGIAHDFNNILTAITSYADLLLSDLSADDEHRGDVEEIHRAALRAAALTKQLLAFSRQQVLAPRVLDLDTVVTGMHSMLQRIIGEDIALVTDLKAEGHVRADPTQMEQVLLNLVVNSRDAMQAGGRLTIATADRVILSDREFQQVRVTPGDYVTLSVSDTGVGMDSNTLARAFEPFFTTKPVGSGTGLGLSTVYGIIKQTGGYVFASSTLGAGTTIDVFLPTVLATAEWPLPAVEPRRVDLGTEVVLLVEDDAGVRRIAGRTLERAGYRVLEAGTAHEALTVVQGIEGSIDLLLTDVVMPGMSGRQLCEQLWLRRPDLSVLFMSGYPGDPGTRDQLLEPGAPFLAKPFTSEELLEAVRGVLKRTPLPGPAA